MNVYIIPETELTERIEKVSPVQIGNAMTFCNDAEVSGFLHYWYDELFVVNFDWANWQEGREFMKQEHRDFQGKDATFCYKLITAFIRQDRFVEGALQCALENSTILHALEWLCSLKQIEASLKYRYTRKPRKCPFCKSSTIAKILYGMPYFSKELEKELDEGKTVLGGCIVTQDDPPWQCVDCDTLLFKK